MHVCLSLPENDDFDWPFLTHLILRAPECFNEVFGGISTMSDMYSFGVILWELVTRQRPWEGISEFLVGGGSQSLPIDLVQGALQAEDKPPKEYYPVS